MSMKVQAVLSLNILKSSSAVKATLKGKVCETAHYTLEYYECMLVVGKQLLTLNKITLREDLFSRVPDEPLT